MPKATAMLAAASVVAVAATTATADVAGVITADNHYALYTSTGGAFSYHGGNELGAGGAPGTYNWSAAESYTFTGGDVLYIAAWSDDSIAQGVLAQFQVEGMGEILSGDARWQVYGSNINRGDGDPHPDALEIASHVSFADTHMLWETPFVGDANGAEPWGTIAGITAAAQWMWRDTPGNADPLHVGSGEGEMLIFRTTIPAPGSLAALGLGLAVVRRRR